MNYKTDSIMIYFAGDLFNHKDLTGNRLLARKMTELANGRYQINLPQNEITDNSTSEKIFQTFLLENNGVACSVKRISTIIQEWDLTVLHVGVIIIIVTTEP